MSNSPASADDHHGHGCYEIRVKGHLDSRWVAWFDGLTITPEINGETLISGSIVDQAALHGLLRTVRDLGMPLISVNRIEPDQTDGSVIKP